MNTATDEAEEDMQASPWPIDIKRWEQKIYPYEEGRVFVCGEGAYLAEQSSLPGGVDRFAYKKTRHRWQESLLGGERRANRYLMESNYGGRDFKGNKTGRQR